MEFQTSNLSYGDEVMRLQPTLHGMLPRKYNFQTTLKVDIADGPNQQDFATESLPSTQILSVAEALG